MVTFLILGWYNFSRLQEEWVRWKRWGKSVKQLSDSSKPLVLFSSVVDHRRDMAYGDDVHPQATTLGPGTLDGHAFTHVFKMPIPLPLDTTS